MARYEHEPGKKGVKYYNDGKIKTINGSIFVRKKGGWVLDFYRDDEDLISEENEVTEQAALEAYVNAYGTDDGFYTYTI